MDVAIQTPALYYSPHLLNPRQPRAAIITGEGVKPETISVHIFADARLDVARQNRAPVFMDGACKLLPAKPAEGEAWPTSPFCVLSTLAAVGQVAAKGRKSS